MSDRRYDGAPHFARRVQPELERIACYRAPTDEEVRASFADYQRGDVPALIETWARVAAPTRATLGGVSALFYAQARHLPRALGRAIWLGTMRAVLAAGRMLFDQQLRPSTARAIRERFAFLERRHEHVPPGWTPKLRFTDAFPRFVDEEADTDEATARFQIVAALNEVQQHVYSRHLAERMALPELAHHAERERQMALAYFAAWSPPATETLWRQSIAVLDGLNAQVFALAVGPRSLRFLAGAARASLSADREWAAFVDGMATPLAL